MTRLVVLVAALVLAAPGAAAASSFRPIASGFDDPVYVTSAPGDAGTLYVVEQTGAIQIFRGGRVVGTFLDLRSQVLARDELGLLSMAFHPRYTQNHLFYVDYTDLNGDTHVVEYRAD